MVETQVASLAQEHPGRAASLHNSLKGLEVALESLLLSPSIIQAKKGENVEAFYFGHFLLKADVCTGCMLNSISESV